MIATTMRPAAATDEAAPDFYRQFRVLLKQHRELKRWSQERLAAECRMDHSLVSRIESGQRSPTRESITKFIEGLDLALEQSDQLFIAAGLLPVGLMGSNQADATALRFWRYLRAPFAPGVGAVRRIVEEALLLAGWKAPSA